MERGTIVLTKFPFTDLSSSKRRPAVFKMNKLATLNKSIFSGELGKLSPDTLGQLEVKLMVALDLRKASPMVVS